MRNKDVQDYSDGDGDGEVEWMEVAGGDANLHGFDYDNWMDNGSL